METKKEPRKDPVRKGPEKKTSPVNNNLVLLLLVIGAVLFVAITVFNNGSEIAVLYSDLKKLVERTDPAVPADASVQVGLVKYSNLSDLRVSAYRVTGKVLRTIEDKAGVANSATVNFSTNLTPPDTVLAPLLLEKGIEFDNAAGPSPWGPYLSMLLLSGLLLLVIFIMIRRLGGAGSPWLLAAVAARCTRRRTSASHSTT